MLKILAIFAILAFSFATQTTESWAGKWEVTAITGSNFCNFNVPEVGTIVTFTTINSTTLNMTEQSNSDSWVLPWGETNTLYSNCVAGKGPCVLGALNAEVNEANATINWYCAFNNLVKLYRGVSLSYLGNSDETDGEENNFLSA